ncbi:hypothetical protein TRFO_18227 [Tritrichomonas foetus]|uniref:Uncharacterized protein n=1 Tax=Tritrichomonas foetus TaxID=1144522 RepID=A0A1J4KQU0_9EUKA|nr:hypothetical protein TRFO_18227 [Tritrichomonas foetus]|eukprot:OHT12038.1 hypothetical protein TRFO_18227 [Tritrichomonas foetus]
MSNNFGMSQEDLKEQLRQAGYGNVPTNIIQEFSQFLQNESENSHIEKVNNNQPPIAFKRKKPKKRKTTKKKKVVKSHQMSLPANFEGEEDIWVTKIQQLQHKANAIDLQLQACCEICADDARYSAAPLYFFNYENFRDPYPKIKKCNGGHGYILPPNWRCSRHRYPIYKNEVYSRPPEFIHELRASERKPRPYVPGVEQRNYDMRFRIKEKMMYSHPDYHV